jgi:hypothetical protein
MISSDLAEHLPPLLDVAARCGARLQQPFVLAVSQWVTISLQLVTTSDELRASVLRFNQEAKRWPYARQLVRATQYWVCDARSKAFGPSKFVGFVGLDAAGYDAARAYQATGARSAGHAYIVIDTDAAVSAQLLPPRSVLFSRPSGPRYVLP